MICAEGSQVLGRMGREAKTEPWGIQELKTHGRRGQRKRQLEGREETRLPCQGILVKTEADNGVRCQKQGDELDKSM